MGPGTNRGHILLADITGYTDYLRGSEIEHAQDVVADLASVIIHGLTPVFEKSKLEGDAVLAYAMAEAVDGSIVLDVVEETYFAFRRRVRDVDLATTCDCNACRLIPSLDLKFVVHFGEFVITEIAGAEELTGTDDIGANRLLKNTVREDLGFDAYALLTEACIDTFGMDPATLGLIEHTDTYDSIGSVNSYVENLTDRWRFEEERRQIFVTPNEAEGEVVWGIDAPVEVTWEHLTSPEKRLMWQEGFDSIDQENPSGKIGVGTTNHCKHGRGEIKEEILDWKPYRYYTLRIALPMIGEWTMTYEFHPRDDGGTHLRIRGQKLHGVKKLFWLMMRPMMMKDFKASEARLRSHLAGLSAEG